MRNDNFSPVKNAEGVDSLETCRNDQLKQAICWLSATGIDFEGNVAKDFTFEINRTVLTELDDNAVIEFVQK